MPDAVCIGMKASIYRAMPEYIVGERIMKIVVLQDDNQKILRTRHSPYPKMAYELGKEL